MAGFFSKALLAQALLLLAINLSSGFKVGVEYGYQYKSTIVNGHWDLKKQFAAAQLSGRLEVIQSEPGVTLARLTKLVASKNGGLEAKLFKTLPGATDEFDPDLDIQGTETPIRDSESLQQWFAIISNNGVFDKLIVGESDPEWVVNIKKSVASQILSGIPGSSVGKLVQGGKNTAAILEEETVTGDCSTTVQVSEVTQAFADSNPLLQSSAAKQICDGQAIVEVTKTKDFNKCKSSTSRHFVIPPLYTCNLDSQSCGDAIQGAETTRYFTCGADQVIVELETYDDFEVKPYGIDTDAVLSTSAVLLVLKDVAPTAPVVPIPTGKEITSLLYTYPKEEQHGSIEVITKQLQEVADQLQAADTAEKDTIGRLGFVRQYLQHSDAETLQKLWEAVRGRSVVQDLFLDALVAAGTDSTVRFVKKLVVNKEVTSVKANWMVIALGQFVRTPSVELLEDLADMVKSDAVQSSTQLKNIANLMLADLLSVSCDSPFLREKRFSLSSVEGRLCSSDTAVVRDFFASLKKDLQSAESNFDKFAILTALGTLGTKEIVPVLLPYIQGNDHDDDTGLRTRAIMSLHRVMFSNPEYVYPLLTSLSDNVAERPEVRMAATALLLNVNSPLSTWQKVAYRTWFEPSRQVAAFVYNLLKSMSRVPPMTPMHKEFARKATLAVELTKPAKFGLPFSASEMVSSWLEEKLGVIQHTPQWKLGDDQFPLAIGLSYWYQLGPFTSSPLQVYVWNYGMEDIWQKICDRLTGKTRKESKPSALDGILDAIRPQSRPKDQRLGALQLNLVGSIQRVFNLDDLDSQIGTLLGDAGAILSKGPLPVSVLKYRVLGEVNLRIPTANGMDVNYIAELPILVSLQGQLNKIDSGVSANLAAVCSWKLTGELRSSLHFSDDYVAAGVETRVDSHLPHLWSQAIVGGRLTAGWTPSSKPTDLIRYQVLPYTIARSEDSPLPITESQDTHAVDTHEATKYVSKFNTLELLGINVQLEVTSQLSHNDKADLMDWFAKWDINSYSNLGFVPLELDARTYVIRYNPGTAEKLSISFFHKVYPKTNPTTAIYRADSKEAVAALPALLILSLSDQAERQVALDLHKHIDGGHSRILSMQVDVEQQGGRKVDVSTILGIAHDDVWSQDYTDLRVDFQVQKPGKPAENIYCIRGFSKRVWNKPPIFGLTADTLYQTEDSLVKFGQSCEGSKASVVHFTAHISRDEAAHAQTLSTQAGQECQKDQALGILDSPACTEAQDLDAIYNIYDLNATVSNLPAAFSDYVWSYGRCINHALYPFLVSDEPTHNAANQFALYAKRDPASGDVDLDIYRPWETLKARQVRGYNIRFSPLTTAYTKVFFPLSARTNFLTDARKLTYAGVDEQRCYISGSRVVTFDQVSYEHGIEGCFHGLVVPTSEQAHWAILGRHVGSGSEVKIVEGSVTILLSTVSNSVKIDDTEYLPATNKRVEIHSSKGRLASINLSSDVIEYIGEDFKVYLKGKQITIKPMLSLRGQIGGVCGDYNLEVTNEFKTPNRCALTSGDLMAHSFKTPLPAGCQPLRDLSAKLAEETAKCDSVDKIIKSSLPLGTSSPCTSYGPARLLREGKVCLSTTPVATCNSLCRPAYKVTKTVGFKCYTPEEADDDERNRMLPLPDFHTEVTVPSSCINY